MGRAIGLFFAHSRPKQPCINTKSHSKLNAGLKYATHNSKRILTTVNFMEETVRLILQDNSSLGPEAMTIDSGADLFAAGLSSFSAVHVMMALEEEWQFEFPDHLMKRATFQTVRSIVDSVIALQGAPVA